MSNYWKFINMLKNKGFLNKCLPYQSIIQLVGDRDKPSISIKDYAFTIPANPMSDRGQLVLEKIEMCLMSEIVVNTKGDSYLCKIEDNEKNINLNKGFVEKKYQEFINKNGYFPEMFNPYNCSEIKYNSPTLSTQCGNTTSSATILINNIVLERENKMKIFNNNLQKYNFNMETIRVFDVFSGIGALHQSLKELGVPIKITNISEIDVDAIISYAGVYINNFKDLDFDYPSEDKMREWLINRNIGYSFEKQKSSIPRLKKDKLYKVYKASVLLNNLGDVSKLNYDDIEDFDLMNFSFSCTDLSTAGKQKGMKNEDGTPTRSGLYVYGINAIKKKKPKYIMIENVKGLIQKKFIDDFYSIIDELNKIGYNCYYPKKENGQPTCLNAKNYGIAQNRERIFVICVRNDVDNSLFQFPKGFDNGLRLKDFLENTVDEKYYLSQEVQDRFKLNGTDDKEHNELNVIGTSTLDFKIRKLTPKECWRLMGFRDECFDRAKESGVADSSLYKQAGNSIVVNCLYYIFKELFKQYIIK